MPLLRALAATACALSVAGLACTQTTEHPVQPKPIRLRVSATTAKNLQSAFAAVPDITYQVATEGGSSITSLQDLEKRKTDIGIPLADVAYLAYSGQLKDMPGAFDDLRGMAVLTLNTVHLVVGGHTGIRTIADLRGKRISLGPPESATALIAEQLLEAHHIGLAEVQSERVSNREFDGRLVRGELDAAFVTFVPPNEGVMIAARAGARLINIEGSAIEHVRTRYPYLRRTLIPRMTYPNQAERVRTVGLDVLLVCRADVDESVVYRLLEAYFATSVTIRPLDLERAPATPIPLHPGAVRYYRQRELSR